MNRRQTPMLATAAAALLLLIPTVRAAGSDPGPVTDLASIKEIDFTGLSDAQKKMALRIMNANPCNCGCEVGNGNQSPKSVAVCRRDMPNSCRRSLIFARTVVDSIREGKDEAAVTKVLQAKAATFVEARLPEDTGQVFNIDVTNNPVRGPKTAPVRIVEFSDFQCPYCADLQKTLDQVLKAFPKDVQVVYKQYPLNIHQYARQAAAASLFAQGQGKFWELHDKMFQGFTQISDENLRKWVGEVGLSLADYDKAIQTGRFEPMIQKDMADGAAAKVLGTPTLFVNGKRIHDRSFEGFKKSIQEELANQRTGSTATPAAAAKAPAKTD
jgi:protein-disulfide isomerase